MYNLNASWAGVHQFIIIWLVEVCEAAKLVEVCAHQLTLKEQITVCIIFQAAARQITLGSSASNEGYPKVRNHREGPY